ncbi:DUF1190 domain-containing protein [Microvirga rosea]|uniref:DUF1190 domain-containing protein n=1 Tax=Microvirga rosea TaxID=2715425 RepID=UPI001D0A437F|nr:DUF1190 domain-containing protein [Microvirga rosea]MCB8822606.1 DUF1190 domain-containing protein [Microvirga rosea]
MKSSKSLRLTLMMGASATLAQCSEAPQSFTSVTECTQYGKPVALCQSAYNEALAEHLKSSPAFGSEAECRAQIDVDQCAGFNTVGSDGSMRHVFLPLMAGYMIGKSQGERRENENAGGGGGGGGGYRYNGGTYHGSPLYHSQKHAEGYWRSSELRTSKFSSNPPNVRTHTFARSGFGGRSFAGGG